MFWYAHLLDPFLRVTFSLAIFLGIFYNSARETRQKPKFTVFERLEIYSFLYKKNYTYNKKNLDIY